MNHQSFLDALCAHPADETLRHVYADWLEERGDARAELLRLEWSTYGKPSPDKIPVASRQSLVKLRAACDLDWLFQFDRANWLRLFGRLELRLSPSHERVILSAEAVESGIQKYESDTGHKLPVSYRAFVSVFQRVALGGFTILTPRVRGQGFRHSDLAEQNRLGTDVESTERNRGWTVFAWPPFSRSSLAWHLNESVEPETREYAIYGRWGESRTPQRVADTFVECVHEFILDRERLASIRAGLQDSERGIALGPGQIVTPFVTRKRSQRREQRRTDP